MLEHIVEDEASLGSIRTKLKPGGRILLTVPANPWMWSAHDTAHHHHRRYTLDSLKAVATKAGLKIHLISHFNSLLFPVAAVARLIGKAMGKQTSDDQMPSPPVNAILTRIFGLETHLVGRVPLPVGVSIVVVLIVISAVADLILGTWMILSIFGSNPTLTDHLGNAIEVSGSG
mgnify:CR=1 FL=1